MPSHTCVGAPNSLHEPKHPTIPFSAAQDFARDLLNGPQRYSCLAGGTRSGKTFLIVRAILERAIHAPESRHAILRFHTNAARASIAQDTLPKVNKICFPNVVLKEHRQDGYFSMHNGSRIIISGLDDDDRVEKILGLEYASVFLNEASQIPYESALIAWTRLAQVVPDLKQHAYVDLNPTNKMHWTNTLFGEKRDPISMQPLDAPEDYARAFLNPRDNAANLSPEFLKSLAALPERQRKRFYEGVYVDAIDDALWSYEVIDANRVPDDFLEDNDLAKVVVAIDPAGSHKANSDATGIIVAGLGTDGDAYILKDLSFHGSPENWASRAVDAYYKFGANCIVAETNYGGDMVVGTLRAYDDTVPIKTVTATRGKAIRAEPISVRYAMGHVHHVGRYKKLEDEFCAFASAGYGGAGSPDHADAAIWALTYLFDLEHRAGIIDFYRTRAEESAAAAA